MDKTQTALIVLVLSISVIISPTLIYGQEESLIPEWIKPIASYWIEGSITDEKFIEVLEFLIEHEVIVIPGYGKIDIQGKGISPMAFSLTTDKDAYTTNERIIISGTLPNDNVADVIVMMIRSVDEVGADMMMVTNDKSGKYETYLTAGIHEAMLEDGEYYIRAQYQGERLTKTFTFTAN